LVTLTAQSGQSSSSTAHEIRFPRTRRPGTASHADSLHVRLVGARRRYGGHAGCFEAGPPDMLEAMTHTAPPGPSPAEE